MKTLFLLSILPTLAQAWTKCIAIYGLETTSRNFVCSWAHPVEFYMKELRRLNFSTIRIPFSYEWVQEKDFKHMDHIFDVAEQYNLTILLDMHRIWSTHQGPSPEEGITLDEFIEKGWLPILDRYHNRTCLKGHNVYNEYTGHDVAYITRYSEQVIQAVEHIYPNRFTYYVTGYVWASTLAQLDMDHLGLGHRLIYSIHRYIWHGLNTPDWDIPFGQHLDHIIVGEFGFKDSEFNWARSFIGYLKGHNITDACFWTIAHSHDTDGMWYDDCEHVNWEKYKLLDTLWH